MAKELDVPPAPDRKRARRNLQGEPRDPVSGLGKALKVFGYDLPKDIYERITETGRYAPKPKPKVKIPYTASDGTILDGVISKEFIEEYENSPSVKAKREKKRQRKEKHANKPYKKKSYSNTTRKAKYKD